MLKTTMSTKINGTSISEDGTIMATMSCTINEEGRASTNFSVVNKEKYEANIEAARVDVDEFTKLYRAEEDRVNAEVNE